MHPLMKHLGVAALSFSAALTALAADARATHPTRFRIPMTGGHMAPTGGHLMPTAHPPVHVTPKPRRPAPSPKPTPPRTTLPGRPSDTPKSGPAVKPHDHKHDHHGRHGDHARMHDRSSKGRNSRYAYWWYQSGSNGLGAGGVPGGASSSSSSSPGEAAIPSYGSDGTSLLAMERLMERADRRAAAAEKKEAESPSSRESKVDPRQDAWRGSLSPSGASHSGTPLNELLRAAKDVHARNLRGPSVPLDKNLRKSVNLLSDKDVGNPGILKDKLTYPPALRDAAYQAARETLDTLLPQAIRQAARGPVDSGQLKEMHEALTKLEDQLASARREEQRDLPKLPTKDYIAAKRFLGQLNDGLRLLSQPDAENYFNGRYAPRAETVAELIDHMTKEGLKFAPAVPGDETAYENLHRALAVYVVTALDSVRNDD